MMLTKLRVKQRQGSQTATTTKQQNPKPDAGTGDSFSPWSRQQVDLTHLLTDCRILVATAYNTPHAGCSVECSAGAACQCTYAALLSNELACT